MDGSHWDVPCDLQADGIYRVAHTQEFRGWVTLHWALYRNTTSHHRQLDKVMRQIETRSAAIE